MKGERRIYLSFPRDLNVEVRGDFEFSHDEAETLAHTYLPGVAVSQNAVKPTMSVEYVESDERRLERGAGHIRIFDNWNGRLSLDIWHFIYSIARLHFLKNELYPVHAACAGKDKYVLLVGHTGSGKSTILLNLLNDYGWSVYAGNKTVVSLNGTEIEAVAGTKSMSLRSTDSTRFPNLVSKRIDYQNRTAFVLDEKHYSEGDTVPVKAIFIAKLNDGVAEVEELTYPGNLHALYPFFLDTVNADTIMCDGNDVFVGTPPEGTQKKLALDFKESLSGIKVIKISGSLNFVTRNIVKEVGLL